MGMALIQNEIAISIGYQSAEELELRVEEAQLRVKTGSTEATSLEWFHLAQEVLTSATSAVDVLSDMLNYDKIASGLMALELTVIPIWRLLERTFNEFRLSATKKNLEFSLDFLDVVSEDVDEEGIPPASEKLTDDARTVMVIGDAVRLTQVLRNLLSNAIKFTPNGGRISLRAAWHCPERQDRRTKEFRLKNGTTVSYPEQGELRVSLEDDGAGMSEEQLAKLFQDGVQFNVNELQNGKGSGLGLYISKEIIEQHDGSLVAHSNGLCKGSTFHLSLPLYSVATEDTHSTQSSNKKPIEVVRCTSSMESESRPRKVLVVDDVSSNRKLLARLLTNRGHVCEEAENGQAAVDMIAAVMDRDDLQPYDTILLDFEMPVMNGPAAARKVREMGCDVFIVGVTGNLLAEDVKHFRDCGANAVLPKPFPMVELESLWIEEGI